MPAIAANPTATSRMRKKFRWMPGRVAANPVTPMWMPFSWLTWEKKSEANHPIEYAPKA